MKKQIIEKDKLIEELKNKNKKLKSQNNNLQYDTDIISNKDQIINLMEELREKEHELRAIKKMLPFDLSPGENLMCVIFISVDQKVHLPVICKNTDIFVRIEEKLYKVYREYKEYNNFFTVSGRTIKRFKSIEENNIKNADNILLNVYQ